MVLAILTPLVLLSETRIKEAIESIFAGCLFVVDVRQGQTSDQIIVHGYMTGKPPARLNLTFHARQDLIERVEFKSGILASPPTPYSSLVLHPKAGQSCPGDLCREPMEITEAARLMTFQLANPSPNFDYLFNVHMIGGSAPAKASDERLVVYSIAGADQIDACRVEPANMFNILTRLGKLERFVAYCLILFGITVLVMLFRTWRGSDEESKH